MQNIITVFKKVFFCEKINIEQEVDKKYQVRLLQSPQTDIIVLRL